MKSRSERASAKSAVRLREDISHHQSSKGLVEGQCDDCCTAPHASDSNRLVLTLTSELPLRVSRSGVCASPRVASARAALNPGYFAPFGGFLICSVMQTEAKRLSSPHSMKATSVHFVLEPHVVHDTTSILPSKSRAAD